MQTNNEETLLWLIGDCFRNRLRGLIQVEPVLDHINSIERDKKDLIINKAKTESNQRAVDVLIDTIIGTPRRDGWFREFVDALELAGCTYAARIVDSDEPPSPSLEARNDYCVQLIDLLAPSLVRMKTTEVCFFCYSLNILTAQDNENIMAETRNRGNMSGACVLLRRITQKPPGWYSTFLDVLRKTEHHDLVHELTGADPADPTDLRPESGDGGEDGGGGVKKEEEDECEEERGQTSPIDFEEEAEKNNMGETSIHHIGSLETVSEHTDIDIYTSDVDNEDDEQLEESLGEDAKSDTEGADEATSEGAAETDIVLRGYQATVAQPALEGKNIIICLPTGSGKTRVAVYITRAHLDGRRERALPGKVVVLVNKVVLVEQHYASEFGRFLKGQYRVQRVSGDSRLKLAFSMTVQQNDVIICMAMILENALSQAESGEDDGVRLADFSLIVVDECHHTQKGEVYQQIMTRHLRRKFKNVQNRKQQQEVPPLPQILGLTASLGVGRATKMDKAQEHVLRLCANLDATTIMTAPLGEHSKDLHKEVRLATRRTEDPFGDVIRGIMCSIHEHATLSPSVDLGTQSYEQWVVEQEKCAAKGGDQRVRVCAEHLRQYNEALHQSNTIRMADAFHFLHAYYSGELRKKRPVDGTDVVSLSPTEKFLFKLFEGQKQRLQSLMERPQYENSVLALLQETILRQFTDRAEARGIIFTETRLSAIALHHWIRQNGKFEEAGVRASYLIGAGDQSAVKPMTPKEQKDVLRKFHSGGINLLIATTVAEEGLDIQKCNVVIRYCLVTNEIAMIQARGRGRAEDSSYIVIGVEGSGVAERESVNECKERMMNGAIGRVREMERSKYENKVKEYQWEAIVEKKMRKMRSKEKERRKYDPSTVRLRCRGCSEVCSGEDIEVISQVHHVIFTDEFQNKFRVTDNTALKQKLQNCEAKRVISCKSCGYYWGPMMRHRGINCPCLNIQNFVVFVNGKEETFETWGELAVEFPAFDYVSHASHLAFSSDEDDDD